MKRRFRLAKAPYTKEFSTIFKAMANSRALSARAGALLNEIARPYTFESQIRRSRSDNTLCTNDRGPAGSFCHTGSNLPRAAANIPIAVFPRSRGTWFTIIIDDTSSKGSLNWNKALTLPTYTVTSPPHVLFSSDNDRTLLSVLIYLEQLAEAAPPTLDHHVRWDVRDYVRSNTIFREVERNDNITMKKCNRLIPVGEYAVKSADSENFLSRELKRTRISAIRAPPLVRSERIEDRRQPWWTWVELLRGGSRRGMGYTGISYSSLLSLSACDLTINERVNSFLTEIRAVEQKDSMQLDLAEQRMNSFTCSSSSRVLIKEEKLGSDEAYFNLSMDTDFSDHDYVEEVAVFKQEEEREDTISEYVGWRLHLQFQQNVAEAPEVSQSKAGEYTSLKKKQQTRLKESAVVSAARTTAKLARKNPFSFVITRWVIQSHTPPNAGALMNYANTAPRSSPHVAHSATPPTNAVTASSSLEMEVAGANPAARPHVYHNQTWYASPSYPKPSGIYLAQPFE
ncbi:hypothetical protein BJ742DRAFT_906627 [Cladochytrium replicatum]|nr:hypothetical protein BJ742DRAFT_906627 [Cladochytrium replicatum]